MKFWCCNTLTLRQVSYFFQLTSESFRKYSAHALCFSHFILPYWSLPSHYSVFLVKYKGQVRRILDWALTSWKKMGIQQSLEPACSGERRVTLSNWGSVLPHSASWKRSGCKTWSQSHHLGNYASCGSSRHQPGHLYNSQDSSPWKQSCDIDLKIWSHPNASLCSWGFE